MFTYRVYRHQEEEPLARIAKSPSLSKEAATKKSADTGEPLARIFCNDPAGINRGGRQSPADSPAYSIEGKRSRARAEGETACAVIPPPGEKRGPGFVGMELGGSGRQSLLGWNFRMATEKMRAKVTLLMCALLMPGLAVTRADAQDGYLVSRDIATVAQHGKNQVVGDIQLEYSQDGGTIDAGETITITFGDLPIAAIGTVTCSGGTCNEELKRDDAEDPAGTAIAIAVSGQSEGNTILVSGARVDVSGLDAGDEVVATISSSAPTALIPVGQSARKSIGAVVATVKAGLEVGISKASRLICNLEATHDADNDPATDETPVGGVPAITVTEGFASAWEEVLGGTRITIETNNLPAGVRLRWPAEVEFLDPEDPKTDVWSKLTLETTEAQAGHADEDAENDGSQVVYAYMIEAAGTPTANDSKAKGVADSFKIAPEGRCGCKPRWEPAASPISGLSFPRLLIRIRTWPRHCPT